MQSEQSREGKAGLKIFGSVVGYASIFGTGAVFLVAKILDKYAAHFLAAYPSLNSHIGTLSDVAVAGLLTDVLAYLAVERFAVLQSLPDETTLQDVLSEQAMKLLAQLNRPWEIRVLATSQETYTEIKKVIDKVNAAVSAEKQLLHGALHRSSAPREPRTGKGRKPKEDPHFEAFDAAMNVCIASRGQGRWCVHQFYNITTSQRLDQIVERLNHGSEGFEVRAVCKSDLIPCFSPLVVGEDDAFLAIVDQANYRVGSSVHIYGKEPVRFITKYFRLLWDMKAEDGVCRLRGEDGIHEDDLRRLRTIIQAEEAGWNHEAGRL